MTEVQGEVLIDLLLNVESKMQDIIDFSSRLDSLQSGIYVVIVSGAVIGVCAWICWLMYSTLKKFMIF